MNPETLTKAKYIAEALGIDSDSAIDEAVNVYFRRLVTEGKIPQEASQVLVKSADEETDFPLSDMKFPKEYHFTQKEIASFSKATAKNVQKAEQGDAKAQNVVGTYYESGNGFEKDYDRAIYWYTKSANQGNNNAQYHLAVLYNKAKDNPLMGYMWFEVARMCGFNITALHKDYMLRMTERLSTLQLQAAQAEAQKRVKAIQG